MEKFFLLFEHKIVTGLLFTLTKIFIIFIFSALRYLKLVYIFFIYLYKMTLQVRLYYIAAMFIFIYIYMYIKNADIICFIILLYVGFTLKDGYFD